MKTIKKTIKKIPKRDVNEWLKLDNAALIYPSAANGNWNAVFRMSAYLKEKVEANLLDKALKSVIKRFPSFNVFLKKGIFWFYFQKVTKLPSVQEETRYPCQPMEFKYNQHLFRVLYYNNKISLEVFHSLTDGTGALKFLNTIVSRYLELKNVNFDKKKCEINYQDKPNFEEIEDSFKTYATLEKPNSRKESIAYQIDGTNLDKEQVNVFTGITSVKGIKEISKSYNCTITELLLGIYFKSIYEYQKNIIIQKKPIKISVPINLRKFFKSSTLRNFSSYINIELTNEQIGLPLDKIIPIIKEQMSKITKSYLMGNINANVKAQNNIIVRIMPLFLKNLALKLSYSLFGERLYTSVISNVGIVKMPEELSPYINRYEMFLGKSKKNKLNMAVCSFKDKLTISFSNSILETKIIKEFYKKLSGLGLDIKIITNLD